MVGVVAVVIVVVVLVGVVVAVVVVVVEVVAVVVVVGVVVEVVVVVQQQFKNCHCFDYLSKNNMHTHCQLVVSYCEGREKSKLQLLQNKVCRKE